MLLLLPPSETKREGGQDATALDLDRLSFAGLTAHRAAAVAALKRVSRSVSGSMAALGLGPTQRFEVDRNRALMTAPVMPAIERYTGVLYDALDVATLSPAGRAFAGEHVVIHSALFGPILGDDPIPAYRLSHNSRLPDLSLRRHWRDAVSAALEAEEGLVVDLRSDSYIALGPAPSAVSIRVVSENARGRRTALSHFNKSGKGAFARSVVDSGVVHESVGSLVRWASANGIRLEATDNGLDLVI